MHSSNISSLTLDKDVSNLRNLGFTWLGMTGTRVDDDINEIIIDDHSYKKRWCCFSSKRPFCIILLDQDTDQFPR